MCPCPCPCPSRHPIDWGQRYVNSLGIQGFTKGKQRKFSYAESPTAEFANQISKQPRGWHSLVLILWYSVSHIRRSMAAYMMFCSVIILIECFTSNFTSFFPFLASTLQVRPRQGACRWELVTHCALCTRCTGIFVGFSASEVLGVIALSGSTISKVEKHLPDSSRKTLESSMPRLISNGIGDLIACTHSTNRYIHVAYDA